MTTHTFSTDVDPALFLEKDDGSGKPVRVEPGSTVLVRDAADGTPLASTTADDLGYLSFSLDDVPAVQVSGDNGATWKGPFYSKETTALAYARKMDLLSTDGVLKDSIVLPPVRAWQAPYMRPATDFGIQLDSTADQTDKVQSALDAAAGDGFDLLLPASTIVCEGQLSWKSRLCNLIGNQGSVLDFSNATFTGPALTVDGEWPASGPKSGMMVIPQCLSGLLLVGPSGSSTTVDGVKIGTDVEADRNPGVTLSQITFQGFRYQEVLANQQWLTYHRGCAYRNAEQHAVYVQGGNNAGEGLRWSDCVIYGNKGDTAAVYIDKTANSDVHFSGGAFDYNYGPSIESHSGTVTLNQVHLETGSGNSAWVVGHNPPFIKLVSETGSSHATQFSMTNCQVMLHGEIVEDSTDVFPMIETVTADGCAPPVVNVNGSAFAQSVDNRWHGGCLSIVEETGTATAKSMPLISMTGVGFGYTGSRYVTIRPGTASNVLADPGFENGLTSDTIAYNSGLSSGWVVDSGEISNVTIDAGKTAPTGQAVKFNYTTAAPSKPLIAQSIMATSANRLINSAWVWIDSGVTPGSLFRTEITWYDVAGNSLGTYPGARLDAAGTGANWRDHWIHTYYIINRPPAGFYGQVRIKLDGTTGTLWLSDVQLAAIS